MRLGPQNPVPARETCTFLVETRSRLPAPFVIFRLPHRRAPVLEKLSADCNRAAPANLFQMGHRCCSSSAV